MVAQEALHALLQQASASGAKSTVLKPLGWLVGILTSGCVLSAFGGAPNWMQIMIGTLLTIAVVAYIGAFIYYTLNDPDALRSEKYTLSKMAIEKTLIGDNEKGFIEHDSSESEVSVKPSALIEEDGQ